MKQSSSKRRLPASKTRVRAKIRKVKHDDPGLTNAQAVGKAMGILRHGKKKQR